VPAEVKRKKGGAPISFILDIAEERKRKGREENQKGKGKKGRMQRGGALPQRYTRREKRVAPTFILAKKGGGGEKAAGRKRQKKRKEVANGSTSR